jgi:hypothetical protein
MGLREVLLIAPSVHPASLVTRRDEYHEFLSATAKTATLALCGRKAQTHAWSAVYLNMRVHLAQHVMLCHFAVMASGKYLVMECLMAGVRHAKKGATRLRAVFVKSAMHVLLGRLAMPASHRLIRTTAASAME